MRRAKFFAPPPRPMVVMPVAPEPMIERIAPEPEKITILEISPAAQQIIVRHSRVTMSAIAHLTAAVFQVHARDLYGESRKKHVVIARWAAMTLCLRLLNNSRVRIGVHFRKDHSTVIHGLHGLQRLMLADDELTAKVVRLEQQLREAA